MKGDAVQLFNLTAVTARLIPTLRQAGGQRPRRGCAGTFQDLLHAAGVLLWPLGMALMAAPALPAQSISFAGIQTTVASDLSQPVGMAVDGRGNVLIADYNNNRVLKVAPDGIQSTVTNGLNGPIGVAVDGAGNLFIADYNDNRVLKRTPDGTQTLVASGLSQPNGLAVDGQGNVLIADTGNDRVLKVTPDGTQSTVGSGLSGPSGAAVDGQGNVFIASIGDEGVLKVAPDGTQSIVASGLNKPTGVAVDRAGNVFIADFFNQRVLKVTPDGLQSTVGSGLSGPNGVAVDAAGNVFIADSLNNLVLKVQFTGADFGSNHICPASQSAPASCRQSLALPYNIHNALTLGTINVLTEGSPNLDFTLASGSTCTGSLAVGSSCSVNVIFAPRLAGLRRGAVQLTDSSGTVLATTLVYGIGLGPQIAFGPGLPSPVPTSGVNQPLGVAVDAAGNVFIADSDNDRVLKVAPDGAQTLVGSGLSGPSSVAVDGAGTVFIADTDNDRVLKVAPDGAQTFVGSGLNAPYGVAVDGQGNVFIADTANNRVLKVAPNGAQSKVPASPLNFPAGVAVDEQGNIFIANLGKDYVLKVTPDGAQSSVGSGLKDPGGVAVDGAGNVFIADTDNDRVLKVAPDGTQSTVVTGLNKPSTMAVDGAGNFFISDTDNDRVLAIQRAQPPTLQFASTKVGSTSSDSPQSLTLENIGNAPLEAIAPGLAIGANFAQVLGAGTPPDCSSTFTLVPSASCNLSLSFTPTVSGALQSAAVLTDNAGNANPATQTIPLKGTGIALIEATTTRLSSNPNPSASGASVVLTATVTPAPGETGAPTGSVSFTDQTTNTAIGSATLATVNGAQVAILNTTVLVSAGAHTLLAAYAGDAKFQASSSVPYIQTVSGGGKVTPAVDLTVNGGASAKVSVGDMVTFIARVHAAPGYPVPTGSVTISDSTNGANTYGQADITKDPHSNDGLATITNASIGAGSYTLVATYGGDNEGKYYNGAQSNTVSLIIQPGLGGPPPKANLSILATKGARTGTLVPILLRVTNNGTAPARDVTLHQIVLHTLTGAGHAALISPTLPIDMGSLAPGASTVLTLQLQAPTTVQKLALSENGTFQDGSGTVYQFSPGQVVFP